MPRGMADGFSTRISFDLNPDIELYEKNVTPPGMEGGDPIDTTTMHNTSYKTKWPQSLIDITATSFTAAYKPAVYSTIASMMNKLQLITITFPDGESVFDYGWLRSFKPNKSAIGEQPTAEGMIEWANETGEDPVTETGLTFVPAP